MRAQLFSMDFVIAMAILTIAIGVTLQTVDNFQKRVQFIEGAQTNNAEMIAQAYVSNSTGPPWSIPGFANATPYCYQFSNTTGNCDLGGGFKCPKNTFTATRLLRCTNTALPAGYYACSIQIRACE
ncbi:MAG: hypothetical protein AABX01_00315 [Candidatus Micrarchaeota archaeon]|mgnify:CR=1 FL=1